MMKFVAGLAALLMVVAGASAQERPAVTPPLITVNGTGQAEADPDMATVRLGVEAQGKTAGAAQAAVSETTQRVIAQILRLVPDRKRTQTSELTLNPVYSEESVRAGRAPQIVAYRARNVVTVRMDDLTKVGPVVDASISAGATNLEGIFFGLRNERPARQSALREAVADARAKAEAMAEALGVTLGPLYTADEGGVNMPFAGYGGRATLANADMSTPVMPGQLQISATVTLRFRIVERR